MPLETLNIYQKLAKIRKSVEVVKKNRKGYGYTYADEEAILSKITGLMGKYGVSLVPGIVHESVTVTPYHYVKTKAAKDGKIYEENVNEVMVYGDTWWRWINDENPDESVVVPWFMVGSQSDASQSFGSALTYSSRYFLLKYFNVSTSDDPDNYRRMQKESEAEEDRIIAEKIVEQIHSVVMDHLSKHPDDKQAIIALTKKYVKENGKASANYYAIQDSATAAELLKAIKVEISKNGEE